MEPPGGGRTSAEMNLKETYGGRTEDFSVQFPLAVDVVLTELDLKSSGLSLKHLNAVHRPNHLDLASWRLREGDKILTEEVQEI